MQKILPSKCLIVSKSKICLVNMYTTTQAWSTKMISLMDGEELSKQIMIGSLMDNGKMEFHMDTIEVFFNMVAGMNQKIAMTLQNIKMANMVL